MTDPQLKLALANWLPAAVIHTANKAGEIGMFHWLGSECYVRDSEWLYLVSLAERQLSDKPFAPDTKSEATLYREALCVETVMEGGPIMASWQHRVRALLKVRGGAAHLDQQTAPSTRCSECGHPLPKPLRTVADEIEEYRSMPPATRALIRSLGQAIIDSGADITIRS